MLQVALDFAACEFGEATGETVGVPGKWAKFPDHSFFEDFSSGTWDRAFRGHDPGAGQEPQVVERRPLVAACIDRSDRIGEFGADAFGECLGRSFDEWVQVGRPPEGGHEVAVDVLGDAGLSPEPGHQRTTPCTAVVAAVAMTALVKPP